MGDDRQTKGGRGRNPHQDGHDEDGGAQVRDATDVEIPITTADDPTDDGAPTDRALDTEIPIVTTDDTVQTQDEVETGVPIVTTDDNIRTPDDIETDVPVITGEENARTAGEAGTLTITADEDEPAAEPSLRDFEAAVPEFEPEDEQPACHLIAVASGRGGAGKSLLAANVAVYLAQMGKRVVAVDADPAGGSLNHLLGTPRPSRGFGSFLRGRAGGLDELAIDTSVAGVRLVAGEAQAFGSPRPKSNPKALIRALRSLGAEYVVVDLGPPDAPPCIDVWLDADTPLLVTLADPASIEATYRFMKSGFLRRVRGERGLDKLQAQLGRTLPTALDLYRAALEIGRVEREIEGAVTGVESLATRAAGGKTPALAATLAAAMTAFRPRFVVSQTRSLGDTKMGPQMAMVAHRRLGHLIDYLGHVEWDDTVAAASRRHRPVMAEFPEAKICKNVERIVRRILSAESERPTAAAAPRLEEEQTFYEILETQPGVSDEEVRRAYRLMKEIYASGSPAICGLYDDAELAALHARANAAHDTLFAPERRRLYDLSLPEADLARAVRRAAHAAPHVDAAIATRSEPSASAPTLDADSEITGALLKKIRESKGLDLSEVAQRTKISERYLRSIEAERFDELPAAVYVRGFVTQMARFLRIDPSRAVESYLRRFHGANGPGPGTPVLKEL